jgi:uncharacterized membrane protein
MKLNLPFLDLGTPAKKLLLILLIIILSFGVLFRFVNLDKKPVWGDEAHTFSVVSGFASFSVISGYAESEVIDKLSPQGIVSVENFLKYQYPNSERGVADTLQKLYTDVHPPLYFLLTRLWVETFGHSVAVLRSASAVFSVLSLPCMYWLCLELFGSPLVGWMATAMLAVAPIQIIYAQEARPYSLLALTVLLSGASLLWAIRTKKKAAWFSYVSSLILGIYTQYFFVLVVFGYVSYVFSIESFKFTSRFWRFLLATFLGMIAFLPWALLVFQNLDSFKGASAWMNQHKLTLPGAIRLWFENMSLPFIDPRASEYFGFGQFGFYFLIPLILLLLGYSFYYLYTKASRQKFLFVVTLIASTALSLICIDLFFWGNRQIWPRYLIPCFLGVQISVAYLLADRISSLDFTMTNGKRKFWIAISVFLITAGILFSSIIMQADTWWNKYGGASSIRVSQIIHQAKNPLIMINRIRPGTILFYNLDPEVKLLFVKDTDLESLKFENNGDSFFLNPSKDMKAYLENQNRGMELLAEFPSPGPIPEEPTQLWKIQGISN